MAKIDLSDVNIMKLTHPGVKQRNTHYTSSHMSGLAIYLQWRNTQNRVEKSIAAKSPETYFTYIWRFRYTNVDGARTSIDIGFWPTMKQDLAIEQAKLVLRDVANGINPKEKKQFEKEHYISRTAVAPSSSVNHLLDSFKTWRQENYPSKESTNHYYSKQIENHIRPRFGVINYEAVSRWVWEEFIRELKTKESDSVARSVHATWRTINTYAATSDSFPDITFNKFLNMSEAKGLQTTVRERFLCNEELHIWMNEISQRGTPTQNRILMLQLYQGLRISEILNIKKSQLKTLVKSYIEVTVKGGRTDHTMFSSQAIELIKNQLRYLKQKDSEGEYLFPAMLDHYKPYTTVGAGDFVKQIRKKWIYFSTHDLRRTTRTWLQEFGCPKEVRDMITNHKIPTGKDASYDHAKRRAEQLRWLQLWADKLDEIKLSPSAFEMDSNTAIDSESADELLDLLGEELE